jgi:hypothetical protein
VLLSGEPRLSQVWLDRLFMAGAITMRVQLLDLWNALHRLVDHTLREAGVPDDDASEVRWEILKCSRRAADMRGPYAHRALARAQGGAANWREMLDCTQEALAGWRRVNAEGRSWEAPP